MTADRRCRPCASALAAAWILILLVVGYETPGNDAASVGAAIVSRGGDHVAESLFTHGRVDLTVPTSLAGLVTGRSLSSERAPNAETEKTLKKRRPIWWLPTDKSVLEETPPADSPTQGSFMAFKKRPERGYAWSKELWTPGVTGVCRDCSVQVRRDPAAPGQTVQSRDSMPFAIPAHFIVPLKP